ncbi:MAG: radical SAM protein [Anaerovoracaceae bacterium]|jgi:MoaA/NifB/PqqE/SkfB family radical SAM enzyme
MSMNSIKGMLTKSVIKQALKYMEKDPDKNLPKLIDWADKIDRTGEFAKYRKYFRGWIENKDGNWYKYMKSLWTDLDDGIRMNFFQSFMLNACYTGISRQRENRAKYNCNIPWAILMDPTTACNLHCKGCWAAEYGNQMSMDLETLDKIVTQGKELGTFMYIYTGGEPLVRKKDIIKMCEMHPDCFFLSFTNATLIDEEFADEMLRVKNFIPAISIEGFEEATDFRRGDGTYKKIIKAMEILQRKKLAYGVSCCYTRQNAEVIGSEAYIDKLIDMGAKFAWFFIYMPVGKNAVPELMCTAEQREYMYNQIRKFRHTKPLFTMDFAHDGDAVGGCIAGGRNYLHINANGDIEPCAFIHYSDSNIHEKTLLEAYQSPLFMAYHDNQPFNDDLYRPCPALDNPEALSKMVHETGAKSTDMESPEDVDVYTGRCVEAAKEWAPVADKLWDAHEKEIAAKNAAAETPLRKAE